jgi:NAD(P)-dependent dehydrogenase (short-subunit alcohol dehydrogenase family)
MSSSVLVTGANSGIGLAAVLELAAAGYDVVGHRPDGRQGGAGDVRSGRARRAACAPC